MDAHECIYMKYATSSHNLQMRSYLNWYAARMVPELLSQGDVLQFINRMTLVKITPPMVFASATARLREVIDSDALTVTRSDGLTVATKTNGTSLSIAFEPGVSLHSRTLFRSGFWKEPVPWDTLANVVSQQLLKANADVRVQQLLTNPRSLGIAVKKPTPRQNKDNIAYLRRLGKTMIEEFDLGEASFVAHAMHYDLASTLSCQKEHAQKVMYYMAKCPVMYFNPRLLEDTDWIEVGREHDFNWVVRTEPVRTVTLTSLRYWLPIRCLDWIPPRPPLSLAQHISEKIHDPTTNAEEFAFKLLQNPAGTLGLTEHELMCVLFPPSSR